MAGAISTEVEEKDTVVFVDRITLPVFIEEDDRLEVFVDGAFGIEIVHYFGGASMGNGAVALAGEDGLLGAGDAIPIVVAIHRVEAAGSGGNESDAEIVDEVLEFFEVPGGAPRTSVTTVGVDVEGELRDAGLFGGSEKSVQVIGVTVDTAGREESLHVENGIIFFHVVEELDEGGIRGEFVVADGLADTDNIGVDDATGADGHVADLAIAHLTCREPDASFARIERGVRAGRPEVINVGCLGLSDGIMA